MLFTCTTGYEEPPEPENLAGEVAATLREHEMGGVIRGVSEKSGPPLQYIDFERSPSRTVLDLIAREAGAYVSGASLNQQRLWFSRIEDIDGTVRVQEDDLRVLCQSALRIPGKTRSLREALDRTEHLM